MLTHWANWWIQMSTDIQTGWNYVCFDESALEERLRFLRFPAEFLNWSRIYGYEPARIRGTMVKSKIMKEVTIKVSDTPGKIKIDSMIFLSRDITLRAPLMSLGKAAQRFLKMGKLEDFPHYMIKPSFFGSPTDFKKLIAYNWKDTILSYKIGVLLSHFVKVCVFFPHNSCFF